MDTNKGDSPPKKERRPPPTNPAYSRRDPGLQVHCMYFYRLTDSPDPKQNVQAYFVDFGRAIDRNIIGQEIAEAKKKIDDGEVTIGGYALGDLRWRRRSYLVFLYEEPGGILRGGDAVTFKDMTGGDLHPFADGEDIKIGTTPCFYCLNHMAYRGGNQPIPPRTSEQFTLHVQHMRKGGRKFERRGHSDTGTNTGPPLQP